MTRYAGAVLAALFLARAAAAQFSQQGSKLVGAGAVGNAAQGSSVAISGDGTTAIVGGPYDDSEAGAAWVYTRSGGIWSQQGAKLVGAGAVGAAYQGSSVAISADGNTAIVGGPNDDPTAPLVGRGAAWVYTRSGGVWSQQGGKLVGSGAVGSARQGASVAISADGNTAILGSLRSTSDLNRYGPAALVFVRSDGKWIQQGEKLVGTGDEFCGDRYSVALSANGDAAILAGFQGISTFIRRNEVWSQQGEKVAVEGFVKGVSISSDGSTFVVGVDGPQRAAAVFARRDGVWVQEGGKLVGRGGLGYGVSVALSGDGTTALLGESEDDDPIGGAWVFIRNSADSK